MQKTAELFRTTPKDRTKKVDLNYKQINFSWTSRKKIPMYLKNGVVLHWRCLNRVLLAICQGYCKL